MSDLRLVKSNAPVEQEQHLLSLSPSVMHRLELDPARITAAVRFNNDVIGIAEEGRSRVRIIAGDITTEHLWSELLVYPELAHHALNERVLVQASKAHLKTSPLIEKAMALLAFFLYESTGVMDTVLVTSGSGPFCYFLVTTDGRTFRNCQCLGSHSHVEDRLRQCSHQIAAEAFVAGYLARKEAESVPCAECENKTWYQCANPACRAFLCPDHLYDDLGVFHAHPNDMVSPYRGVCIACRKIAYLKYTGRLAEEEQAIEALALQAAKSEVLE